MASLRFAVVMLLGVALAGARPPCPCTSDLNEVCGSDGKTYDNACNARCNGATAAYSGPCATQYGGDWKKRSSECKCPAVLRPVCGSDGNDYDNACAADCAGASVAYRGSCGSPEPELYGGEPELYGGQPELYGAEPALYNGKKKRTVPCVCSKKWDPYCGTDDNTYANLCQIGCSGVAIAFHGTCENPTPTLYGGEPELYDGGKKRSTSCICPLNYVPVCGTDGDTYGNACGARCSGVAIAFQGTCENPTPTLYGGEPELYDGGKKRRESCICPMNYVPVCGTDGDTYGNACGARCSGVAIASQGTCENPTPTLYGGEPELYDGGKKRGASCICPLNYVPVCGTDGETYGNACGARCSGVAIAFESACDNPTPELYGGVPEQYGGSRKRSGNGCRRCNKKLDEVCGVDGQTYNNQCLAECNNAEVDYSGPCAELYGSS